jgi:hypothetical protein
MAEQRYGRMPQKGTAESQATKREELFNAGSDLLLDSMPVIGGFRAMGRAADEFKAGNTFMGALELAGAIPMVGLPIKAVAKAARGISVAKPYRTDSRYIPQLPKNDPASRTNIPTSIAEDLSKEFDEFPLSGIQSVSFKNIEGQNVIDQVEVVDSFIRPVDVSKIKDRPDFSEVISTAKIRELQDMGLVSKTLDPEILDQELTQLALKNRTRVDLDTGVLYEPTVLLKVKKDSFIDAPARRGTYQDGPDGVDFEFVEVPLDTFEAMQKRRQQATLTSADNLSDADTFEVPIDLQPPEFLDVNKSVGYRLGDDVLDGGYPSSINVGRGSSFEGGQEVAAEGIESFLDSLRNPPSKNRSKAPTFTTEDLMRAPANQPFAYGGVVSLKDKAVNMNRGPRSNGIMQYVPYMTGATNGY